MNLNKHQCEGIVERIEDHIDSTSYDWQVDEIEHNEAIAYWSDILRELGYAERADSLDKEYMI